MKKTIWGLILIFVLISSYFIFKNNDSENNDLVFIVLDKERNYGYYTWDGDTVYSYRIDSLNAIVPEELIYKYLNKKDSIITRNSINGRSTYIYDIIEGGVLQKRHLIPFDAFDSDNFSIHMNNDTLNIGDTLSLTFIVHGEEPAKIQVQTLNNHSIESDYPLATDHNRNSIFKAVCKQKGENELKGEFLREELIGLKSYPFNIKYFVK